MRALGWPGFGAWTIAGGLLFFAWVTGFSIGILVLPVALLAIWLAARFAPRWPQLLGALPGAGLVCLAVAIVQRDSRPCGEGGLTTAPGETSAQCGGAAPLPWLVAGLVLLAVGTGAFALVLRARRSPRPDLG